MSNKFSEIKLRSVFNKGSYSSKEKEIAGKIIENKPGLDQGRGLGTARNISGVFVKSFKGKNIKEVEKDLKKIVGEGRKPFIKKYFNEGPTAKQLKLNEKIAAARTRLNIAMSARSREDAIGRVNTKSDGAGGRIKITARDIGVLEQGEVSGFAGGAADRYGAGAPHSVTGSNLNGEGAFGLTNNPNEFGNGAADDYAGFGDMGKVA